MKELTEKDTQGIEGGIAWMAAVVAPILVGVSVGVSNQVAGAIINNWAAFKQGVKETAI